MRVDLRALVAKSMIEIDDWAHLDEQAGAAVDAGAGGRVATVDERRRRRRSASLPASCHPAKELDAAKAARRERT